MMKSLFKMLMLVMLTVISTDAAKAQASTLPDFVLTNADKANCTQFKSLQGQDRLDVFKKIMPLIKTENQNLPTPINTADDVINFLGQPDEVLTGNFYQYNLKSAVDTCKAIIKVDKNQLIIFYIIKDCN